jgi:hypothetical protein
MSKLQNIKCSLNSVEDLFNELNKPVVTFTLFECFVKFFPNFFKFYSAELLIYLNNLKFNNSFSLKKFYDKLIIQLGKPQLFVSMTKNNVKISLTKDQLHMINTLMLVYAGVLTSPDYFKTILSEKILFNDITKVNAQITQEMDNIIDGSLTYVEPYFNQKNNQIQQIFSTLKASWNASKAVAQICNVMMENFITYCNKKPLGIHDQYLFAAACKFKYESAMQDIQNTNKTLKPDKTLKPTIDFSAPPQTSSDYQTNKNFYYIQSLVIGGYDLFEDIFFKNLIERSYLSRAPYPNHQTFEGSGLSCVAQYVDTSNDVQLNEAIRIINLFLSYFPAMANGVNLNDNPLKKAEKKPVILNQLLANENAYYSATKFNAVTPQQDTKLILDTFRRFEIFSTPIPINPGSNFYKILFFTNIPTELDLKTTDDNNAKYVETIKILPNIQNVGGQNDEVVISVTQMKETFLKPFVLNMVSTNFKAVLIKSIVDLFAVLNNYPDYQTVIFKDFIYFLLSGFRNPRDGKFLFEGLLPRVLEKTKFQIEVSEESNRNLYYALAQSFYNLNGEDMKNKAEVIRKEIINYIESNVDSMKDILRETTKILNKTKRVVRIDQTTATSKEINEAYVKYMKSKRYWPNDVDIFVFTRLTNSQVYLISQKTYENTVSPHLNTNFRPGDTKSVFQTLFLYNFNINYYKSLKITSFSMLNPFDNNYLNTIGNLPIGVHLNAERHILSDGSIFYGSLDVNKKPSGTGFMVYTNGATYDGNFVDGSRSGQGTYISKNTGGFKYSGLWSNNNMDGKGTYTFTNGYVYDGNISNNQMNGLGTLTFTDGSSYSGKWENNMMNGEGLYLNNARSPDLGFILFNGNFYKNSFNGSGQMTYMDNTKYLGAFKNNIRDGKGSLFLTYLGNNLPQDLLLFEGSWKNDQKEGDGAQNFTYLDKTLSTYVEFVNSEISKLNFNLCSFENFFKQLSQDFANLYPKPKRPEDMTQADYENQKKNQPWVQKATRTTQLMLDLYNNLLIKYKSLKFYDTTEFLSTINQIYVNTSVITGRLKYEQHKGKYAKNKMNGKGTMKFSNGATYVGDFFDDEITGEGKFVTATNEAVYVFKYGKEPTPVTSFYEGLPKYIGSFVGEQIKWKFSEAYEMKFREGILFDKRFICFGDFVNDQPNSAACFYFNKELVSVYFGQMQNGVYEGFGCLIFHSFEDDIMSEFTKNQTNCEFLKLVTPQPRFQAINASFGSNNNNNSNNNNSNNNNSNNNNSNNSNNSNITGGQKMTGGTLPFTPATEKKVITRELINFSNIKCPQNTTNVNVQLSNCWETETYESFYTNGSNMTYYVGDFENGVMSGEGFLGFSNGTEINGSFKDDRVFGVGKIIFIQENILNQLNNFQKTEEKLQFIEDNKSTVFNIQERYVSYDGNFENGIFSGYGELEFYTYNPAMKPDDKDYTNKDYKSYKGFFYQGVFEGNNSTLVLFNGDTYTGSFKNGLYNGFGELKFNFKSLSSKGAGSVMYHDLYKGQFKNGVFHGQGELQRNDRGKTFTTKGIFVNGEIAYTGQYNDEGQKDGQGTLRLENGDRYVGNFKNDVITGTGTYYFADGSTFVGEFVDNSMTTGQITFSNNFDDKRVTFTGKFAEKSKFADALKKFISSDDNIYQQSLKFTGQGKMTYRDGSTYDGSFKDGLRSGQGTYVSDNGNLVYEGSWKNNVQSGQGTLRNKSNFWEYVGNFKNGVQNGLGILKEKARIVYDGEWLDGKQITKAFLEKLKSKTTVDDQYIPRNLQIMMEFENYVQLGKIELKPKMLQLSKSEINTDITLFYPLSKYSETVVKQSSDYNRKLQFYNNSLFLVMLSMLGNPLSTLEEATNAKYIDNNIIVTLNALLPVDGLLTINGEVYTILSVDWKEGDWRMDIKTTYDNRETLPYYFGDDRVTRENQKQRELDRAMSELNNINSNLRFGANFGAGLQTSVDKQNAIADKETAIASSTPRVISVNDDNNDDDDYEEDDTPIQTKVALSKEEIEKQFSKLQISQVTEPLLIPQGSLLQDIQFPTGNTIQNYTLTSKNFPSNVLNFYFDIDTRNEIKDDYNVVDVDSKQKSDLLKNFFIYGDTNLSDQKQFMTQSTTGVTTYFPFYFQAIQTIYFCADSDLQNRIQTLMTKQYDLKWKGLYFSFKNYTKSVLSERCNSIKVLQTENSILNSFFSSVARSFNIYNVDSSDKIIFNSNKDNSVIFGINDQKYTVDAIKDIINYDDTYRPNTFDDLLGYLVNQINQVCNIAVYVIVVSPTDTVTLYQYLKDQSSHSKYMFLLLKNNLFNSLSFETIKPDGKCQSNTVFRNVNFNFDQYLISPSFQFPPLYIIYFLAMSQIKNQGKMTFPYVLSELFINNMMETHQRIKDLIEDNSDANDPKFFLRYDNIEKQVSEYATFDQMVTLNSLLTYREGIDNIFFIDLQEPAFVSLSNLISSSKPTKSAAPTIYGGSAPMIGGNDKYIRRHYRNGESVEFKMNGRWYEGTVFSKRDNGTYTITYDKTKKALEIKPEDMQPYEKEPNASNLAYKITVRLRLHKGRFDSMSDKFDANCNAKFDSIRTRFYRALGREPPRQQYFSSRSRSSRRSYYNNNRTRKSSYF